MTAGSLVPGEALGVSWPDDGLGRVPQLMRPTRGTASANEWPLHDFLELGALPSAVPCARLHARHLLREWALVPLTDSVELIVSELTTNAIQASHVEMWADPIQLWLLSDTTRGWSQPVEAIELKLSPGLSARRSSANTSAGVLNPSIARGRSFISSATA